MTVRRLCAVVVLCALAAACGGDDESAETTSAVTTSTAPSTSSTVDSSTTTSSTVPATSSTVPATSSTSTSSTVAAPVDTTPAPTTTIPSPGAPLTLGATGLGSALFGVEVEGVIGYVRSFLGQATSDTGWVDPLAVGACPGSEVRLVSWNDLTLYFSDESPYASGARHFFAYRYGPKFGPNIDPYGLRTAANIRIDDPVALLRSTYPEVVIEPPFDDGSLPYFEVEVGLRGFVTSVDDAGKVSEILGGFGCGE